MKRLLQLGFLLGFAATAAAGYFLPWISYERYPSATNAVINGGRSEQFLIRLPNDRLYAATNTAGAGGAHAGAGPVHTPYPAGARLDSAAPTAVEHYKLRDIDGNVVGVAARHTTAGPAGNSAAWLLSLPSRGVIVFGGPAGAIDGIDRALTAAGWIPGSAYTGELSVPRASGMPSVHVTREFSGIEFRLDETWDVTGIDDDGRLRGTIRLDTLGRRPQ